MHKPQPSKIKANAKANKIVSNDFHYNDENKPLYGCITIKRHFQKKLLGLDVKYMLYNCYYGSSDRNNAGSALNG